LPIRSNSHYFWSFLKLRGLPTLFTKTTIGILSRCTMSLVVILFLTSTGSWRKGTIISKKPRYMGGIQVGVSRRYCYQGKYYSVFGVGDDGFIVTAMPDKKR
jgi:hypothetical protein